MKNKQNGYPAEPFMEDDTKIYFPSGQSYTSVSFFHRSTQKQGYLTNPKITQMTGSEDKQISR